MNDIQALPLSIEVGNFLRENGYSPASRFGVAYHNEIPDVLLLGILVGLQPNKKRRLKFWKKPQRRTFLGYLLLPPRSNHWILNYFGTSQKIAVEDLRNLLSTHFGVMLTLIKQDEMEAEEIFIGEYEFQ